MKKLSGIIICLFMLQAVFSQSILKYQTPVKLKTENSIKSNEDTPVRIVVAEEIRDSSGHVILIASGAPVECRVYRTKAQGLGKAGTIRIYPISVVSVDGQLVLLDGALIHAGKNRKTKALAYGIGSGLTFLPGVGFCFLMLKGKQAVLSAGTVLEGFSISNTYYIAPELNLSDGKVY